MLTLGWRSAAVVALGCAVVAGCSNSSGSDPYAGHSVGQVRSFTTAAPPPRPTPSPGLPSAPTIVSISPAMGPPGTHVTITGTGFDNLSDVQIGGVKVVNITYLSTTITGTVGEGAAGPADVVVLAALGNATLVHGFSYQVPNPQPSPSPSPGGTTYTNTIAGIMANDCVRCHPGFSTYQSVASMVTPGDSASSVLIQAVSPGGRMSGNMPAADIATVSAWINAGAPQ